MSQFARNFRSISQETHSKIHETLGPTIQIMEPKIKNNYSQFSSSIRDTNRSQVSIQDKMSIPDKISMLNESIRISEKNEKYFQQNMKLKQQLRETQQALQDANIKCSLWDKLKMTIQGLNKQYLHLKSIQNNCTDGTVLKQFISVLKEKLQKISAGQMIQRSYSVQSKRKDTQYYQLYEQQKRQRYQYQQHIITLNNQIDMLQQQNQKVKDKLKSTSLTSSGIIGSNGKIMSTDDKQLQEQVTRLRQQNICLVEHNGTLLEQLEEQRLRVKEIQQGLDKYQCQLKDRQMQLKRKMKDIQTQLQLEKQIQKTLKSQLEEEIQQNSNLHLQVQKLTNAINSASVQSSPQIPPTDQNQQQIHTQNYSQEKCQSRQYLQLVSKNKSVSEKYKQVKAQNQVLGQQRQNIGKQMEQLQRMSKQMEYNYQVKIDDLRKQCQEQIQDIIQNFNERLNSMNQDQSKNELQKGLGDLMSAQDQNKQAQVELYEGIEQNRHQDPAYHQELNKKQSLIIQLEQRILRLNSQFQQKNIYSINYKQAEQAYSGEIGRLENQCHKMNSRMRQLNQEISSLKLHIQTLNKQLDNQDSLIQKFKVQLIKKDQILVTYLNQPGQMKQIDQLYTKKENSDNFRQQFQTIRNSNQQFRKAPSEQSNSLFIQNIFDWQSRYMCLFNQNKGLLLDICQLRNQIKLLNQQIEHQIQAKRVEQIEKKISQSQQVLNFTNMDGLMAESLKQQMQTLLEQNRLLEQQNNKYQHQFNQSQLQVQQIQRYVKMISVQNKKIPHYEQQLIKQRIKCDKLKHRIIQQKQKFMSIMGKNQSLYQQLLRKSQKNEQILRENIKMQKEQTVKLQNLIKKYYDIQKMTNAG